MAKPQILKPCSRLSDVRLLSLDVDGVLTDGGLFFDEHGVALLRFHVQDGLGLKMLMATGVKVCIATQSNNKVIERRAKSLGIEHLFMGVENKEDVVVTLAEKLGIPLEAVCHIADDVNDLSLLKLIGVPVTVPNGVASVKEVCDFITGPSGGNGAVRELCDAIIASQAR